MNLLLIIIIIIINKIKIQYKKYKKNKK
jgi:hypothetical protein